MIAEALWIVARGFVQVAPVSASTYFVSHDRVWPAVALGGWISFAWWLNAGSAAELSGPWWALAYATGAACGTLAGQLIARRLTRR